MAERGNCKFFAPNFFNPTKCQNCFKQKDQHSEQPAVLPNQVTKQPLTKRNSLGKGLAAAKVLLIEGNLLRTYNYNKDQQKVKDWVQHWFCLFSNGELQSFDVVDGQEVPSQPTDTVYLHNYIRMLDGKEELNEYLIFGVKTLRDTTFFKTATKVEFVNWWKEFSNFVSAPLKRCSPARQVKQTKAYSSPLSNLSSKVSTLSSRSSSVSSLHEVDTLQMDGLRNKISKLEDENLKLSKAESERRKLQLEVNYWKEYVTDSQNLRKSGKTIDSSAEFAETRKQLIQVQDELNETNKRLKTQNGKLVLQNKELANMKERLLEANSIAAVYKAKNEQLGKELANKSRVSSPLVTDEAVFRSAAADLKSSDSESNSSPVQSDTNDAHHLKDKFLVLKDKLKRIERELYLKSKELEKANESRSKVAKYTRSLLHELETRLSDTQAKYNQSETKLKNALAELQLERDRRLKTEDASQRRLSGLATPSNEALSSATNDAADNPEDSRYADYFRSRYKEAEAALLQKDKKLHEAETKIKEIQQSMRSNSDNYKVIAELQTNLSKATHKLSDRQLKLHELTRELDNLRGIEKTYERKSKQCETLEDIVKDLETKNSEHKKNFHIVKQEMELLRIREVVLKEQLQTLVEDNELSDDEDDEEDQLRKSIEMKKKIDNLIETECLVKKLTLDKESLENKNKELESRLRKINIENFKNIESAKISDGSPLEDNEKKDYEKRVKELETRIFEADDKYLNKIRLVKEEHLDEITSYRDKNKSLKNEMSDLHEQLDNKASEFVALEQKLAGLENKASENEQKYGDEVKSHSNTKLLLDERSCLLKEIEERSNHVTVERDLLKSQIQKQQDNNESYALLEENNRLRNENNRLSTNTLCEQCGGLSATSRKGKMLTTSDEDIFAMQSEKTEEDTPEARCRKYTRELAEMTRLLVSSEESAIKLARDLEARMSEERDYEVLDARLAEMQQKIADSHEALQQKADGLEKERKNVLYLVDVTSVYIKKLETSLAESKQKVQELQGVVDLNKEMVRAPPDGSSADADAPTLSDEINYETLTTEQWKAIRQKLTTKIMMLESDISELRATEDARTRARSLLEEVQESPEEMQVRIEQLEEELRVQSEKQQKDIESLQQHFEGELKAAFGGDTGSYEMINRIQELEIQLEETRNSCAQKVRDMQKQFDADKKQLEDDMAIVFQGPSFQASLTSCEGDEQRSGTVEELEERIIKLEEQLEEQKEKFEDKMQMEKDTHKQDMEDTIKDMLMVRNASSRDYDEDDNKIKDALSDSKVSQSEIDELRATYEAKIVRLTDEHEDQLDQVRADMSIIVNSISQGSSSDAIIELQNRIKELEQEVEDSRGDTNSEIEELRLNLKRSESAHFFCLRRNEEMGSKIYYMQIEMEEVERKHQLVVQAYQEQLESLGVDVNVGSDSLRYHEELEVKNKQLQDDLDRLYRERDSEMEAYAIRLQEEKREAIQAANDNAMRLEALVDEMKSIHEKEKKELEESLAVEKNNATLKKRVEELEIVCENLKEEYEEEIEMLTIEQKKEVERLRLQCDKELGEAKKANNYNGARRQSVDQTAARNAAKDLKDKHDKEMENLKKGFEIQQQQSKITQEREIDDIRMQYDEKLKMSYQDGMRRQSVSERKSDATKIRELINEKDQVSTKLLELEIKHEKDCAEYQAEIERLRAIIEGLLASSERKSKVGATGESETSLESLASDENTKVEEFQEQIKRYERRIEYYQQKSLRENCVESERVLELQSDVVSLHKKIELIKDFKRRAVYEAEKKEKPTAKQLARRNTDGSTARRHTDTDAEIQARHKHEGRDPRQRWSNLEERTVNITRSISELDGKKNPRLSTLVKSNEGKSGTVLARKTLWENITDEPKLRRTPSTDVK